MRLEGWLGTVGCCLGYCLVCGVAHGCCCFVVPWTGQRCCRCAHQLPSGEFAVFYDFGSLHQKDEAGERTPAEREAFDTALEARGAAAANFHLRPSPVCAAPTRPSHPRAPATRRRRQWACGTPTG